MVEVESRTERREEITFVRATVTNTRSTPQAVRLESRLDGPTWPPRCGEFLRPEWSGGRWEATVQPGRSRGLGFASPAEPADQPLEIVSSTRATSSQRVTSTAGILTALDDWAPTSDVLSREP